MAKAEHVVRYLGQYTHRVAITNQRIIGVDQTTVTTQECILRITGFDRYQCPFCKTGIMHTVELLPRIRSPTNVLYKTSRLTV